MNWDAVGAIAETIGVLGVIVTVGYLAIQVRQSNRQEAVHGVQAAVKEFVNAYAAVTADELSAENFRAGLNQFDELTRNDKAIFHSKMQLLASGLYQVMVMYESGMLPDEELYSKSESLFLSFVLSPGGNQWWEAYKHLPPKMFKTHVDKRLSDENLNITPANEDLDWYKID